MDTLRVTLDKARQDQKNVSTDALEGMAWVFEDTPASKPLGLFTIGFAKAISEADPLYTWREA